MLLQDFSSFRTDRRADDLDKFFWFQPRGIRRCKQDASRLEQWQCGFDQPAVILFSLKNARRFGLRKRGRIQQ